jgi:hypothetical protein
VEFHGALGGLAAEVDKKKACLIAKVGMSGSADHVGRADDANSVVGREELLTGPVGMTVGVDGRGRVGFAEALTTACAVDVEGGEMEETGGAT